MAITQDQADNSREFHDTNPFTGRACDSKNGPIRWRRNGQTKRWKRTPERFQIPVKHGLRSYDYIDNRALTADDIHAVEDCPVNA